MRVAFDNVFESIPDGSCSTKKYVKIGSVILEPGTPFIPGVVHLGLDIAKIAGCDLDVHKFSDGVIEIQGAFINSDSDPKPREEIQVYEKSTVSKGNVMVVEDEGIVALQIKQDLELIGYLVPMVALSGEEAIGQLAEVEPDVVLMDIKLKGYLNGIETATHIKSVFDIPIIYLSAYSDEETLKEAQKTEPFGYILKPFDNKQLHAAIQMALHGSRAMREQKHYLELLSAMLSSMAEAVIVSDLKGRIQSINPAAEELTCEKNDAVNGKSLSQVLRFLDRTTRHPSVMPVSAPIVDGESVFCYDQILITKAGTEVLVEYSLSPLRIKSGSIIGMIMVLRNLSRKQQACSQDNRKQ